jgi:circadian clock protein KaiB
MKRTDVKSTTNTQRKLSVTGEHSRWYLRLFVAGRTQKAIKAFNNLKLICEEKLSGQYKIEVIDLLKNPQLARDYQIVAIPTLIRNMPLPERNIIGDLSDKECVLAGLDLTEHISTRYM